MIIVCPRCGILYGVDPDDLAASCTVRCSNCDREWLHTPAASLPDSDEALRLLAASLGRDGPAPLAPPHPSPPRQPPPAPRRADRPSPSSAPGRDDRANPPAPRLRAAEPDAEPRLRPAPVTTLYPPAPTAAASVNDASSRGARLSSRQLDALLNGSDGSEGGTGVPPEAEPLEPAPAPGEAGERPSQPGTPSPRLREAATTEPAAAVLQGGAAPAPAAETEEAGAPPAEEADAGEDAAPSPRLPLLRRQKTAVVAAGAVAAALLLSVGLLAATRGLVMAAFPGAAGFYAALGLAPTDAFAEGLEIRGVSSSRSWSDGEQILTVAGDLANVAEQPRSLPMVRVVLVDGSDAEVQEVVVLPPGETLPVGESIRFEARISNPSDTAERIKVSLAPRPEPS
jgi:predicted Zn finger-like uncharacterized protein